MAPHEPVSRIEALCETNDREVPISDIGNSFDHLVGELLELHWHIET
jgi:hypothetical protein